MPELRPARQLTLTELMRLNDQGAFRRGFDYFNAGHVRSAVVLLAAPDLDLIESEVHGSGSKVYQQHIQLAQGQGGVLLDGECSCPVGHNCKHVVAVCLALLADNQGRKQASFQWVDAPQDATPGDPFTHWLRRFSALQDPAQGYGASRREQLAYVLRRSEAQALLLEVRIVKRASNGGFTKGTLLGIEQVYERCQYRYQCAPSDWLIGQLGLLARREAKVDRALLLQGEIGGKLLIQALESGRLYWSTVQGERLARGPAQKLTLGWQTQGDELCLALQVESRTLQDDELIRVQPPMYLDLDAAQIGELVSDDFNAAQIEMLAQAPPVAQEQAEETAQRLLADYPQSAIPAPVQIELQQLQGVTPVPCLRLQDRETIGLRFDYAGHWVSPEDPHQQVNVSAGDKLVQVHRELEAETDAVRTLMECGFEEQPFSSGTGWLEMVDVMTLQDRPNDYLWWEFLNEAVPRLQQQGWQVERDAAFPLRFDEAEDWRLDLQPQQENDWFGLSFDLLHEGRQIALLPLVLHLLEQLGAGLNFADLPEQLLIEIGEDHFVSVPRERLRPVLDNLLELLEQRGLDQSQQLSVSRLDAAQLSEFAEQSGLSVADGAKALLEMGQRLRAFSGIQAVPPPQQLQAELRGYQQQGLNWLQFLREYQLGGILADDMGLGKTVQVLAHLQAEKEAGRLKQPALVIAPTSLMGNWRREAEKFTPQLSLRVLHGPDRHKHFRKLQGVDVLLTTYPLLSRDEKSLSKLELHYLILDEAQVIKNAKAKASRIVRKLKATHRLCLTGTPMENHLGELWALFDFLLPGFLGDGRTFNRVYRTPIEKHQDTQRRQALSRRVAPFMLRRTKEQVAAELPAKTEILRSVPLGPQQSLLYESIRLSMEQRVRETIERKGLGGSHITILDALLKLRQICCDPRLLSLKEAANLQESAKLDMLLELLAELLEEGRRILLFSQFAKMLILIEAELKKRKIPYTKLTGQTRKREQVIEQFTSGAVPLFLISLKAGGVGLNLVEADTVIHYDPWWNPAVERQATDRAHRIGQDKPVFVYKLVTERTLEERILQMQERKQALADGVYGEDAKEDIEATLDAEQLQQLLRPIDAD